jgi:hypothetical protein
LPQQKEIDLAAEPATFALVAELDEPPAPWRWWGLALLAVSVMAWAAAIVIAGLLIAWLP